VKNAVEVSQGAGDSAGARRVKARLGNQDELGVRYVRPAPSIADPALASSRYWKWDASE
jgi:hypothetical protein